MYSAHDIATVVGKQIAEAASDLRPDVLEALISARACERSPRGCRVLDMLIENAHIARSDELPLCQDTGTVGVILETGEDCAIPSGTEAALNAEVARVYKQQGLRASTVRDALFDRVNPGDNTPVFVEYRRRSGTGLTVHTMLKGAGSDNASQVLMLSPASGRAGIMDALTSLLQAKASRACPPLLIGVGIGSTFDKVAGLARQALLRPIGSAAASAHAAAFEAELLALANATGIGPGGFGGDTTALAVHICTAPCHIAALPLAFNLGCPAMRSRSEVLG
jgi:fumarate hydratase class I/fumarate hydratase subunit alpha